ncbi:MAG: hypothetical protein WBM99_10830 [Psychromonas sp.]
MSTAIQIKQLLKVYELRRVLKNLDLQIATGKVFGLFDHNDSGKTATLKL